MDIVESSHVFTVFGIPLDIDLFRQGLARLRTERTLRPNLHSVRNALPGGVQAHSDCGFANPEYFGDLAEGVALLDQRDSYDLVGGQVR
jgi:hypothetical protein